ncbi:hypothetical protein BH11ACT2_BH11ACT2_01190 [soil metagenome]
MASRYRRSRPSIGVTLVVLAVLVIAALVHGATTAMRSGEAVPAASAAAEVPAGVPDPASTSAAGYSRELDAVAIGSRPAPGYARDRFGDGWKDPDHNGCDTRNDVLARDLESVTFKPGTHDCVVLTGTLHDPYTGTTIGFVRGNLSSEAVQIDHIVPLSWSWSHGAAGWTDEKRLRFANDPANLRAVDGPTNGAKSDSGPADWMPPSAAFACSYIESFVAVVSGYGLSVDRHDAQAMRATLSHC